MDEQEQTYKVMIEEKLRQQGEPDLNRATEQVRKLLSSLQALDEERLERARVSLEQDISARVKRTKETYTLSSKKADWYDENKHRGIHWPALADYLVNEKGWPEENITESISPYSTKVVCELGDPAESEFDIRGMVVGYVQSGKTANMTAVIARAVDAGYNFVVVLAGMTDKLRHQTQARLEADLCERSGYNWHRLTRQNEYDGEGRLLSGGDYIGAPSRTLPPLRRDVTMIAVIKKHPSIIEKLIEDVRKSPGPTRKQLRALIIDDEADQASPNGGRSDEEAAKTNRRIRQLIHSLPAVSYIGYTATPYANILINPWPVDISADEFETSEELYKELEDLYPRSFIISLPRPEGYFGAEQIFGREPSDAEDEGADGLEVIRVVAPKDVEALSFKEDVGGIAEVPALREAVRWFLLTVAARLAREQGDQHQSMLIHTSSRTDDHKEVLRLVRPEIDHLKAKIYQPDLLKELKQLWDSETIKISASEFGYEKIPFGELQEYLSSAADRISIAKENSKSEERLNYEGAPMAVIAIGGNILARGLTLEGLTVTFFTRSSKQYDTLLQMGRWFGYRQGYEDLVRIWMPEKGKIAFRQLAMVEHELREEIAEYAERRATPLDFAARIRTLPGLQVTARNKMRHATTANIDYRGLHLQTIRFPRFNRNSVLSENWEAGTRLVEKAEITQDSLCGSVEVSEIIKFFRRYQVEASHRELSSEWLEQYISTNADTLSSWSVCVFQPKNREAPMAERTLGCFHPCLINRSRLDGTTNDIADIKALMSRADVMIDVPKEHLPNETNWRQNWSWAKLKKAREDVVGSRPLIILYPVDKDSKPSEKSERVDLNAEHDILGIGLVFPQIGVDADKRPTRYIQVDLRNGRPSDFNEHDDEELEVTSDGL